MFFNCQDTEAEIISVLHINRGNSHAYARERDFEALALRIHGSARFTHGETVFDVNAGDILYIPQYYDYRIDAGEEELLAVHFHSNNRFSENEPDIFTPIDFRYFERKLDNMCRSWSFKKTGYLYSCKSDFYKILMRISEQRQELNSNDRNKKIEQAADYIHEHYSDKNLSVDALAKMANMSDTYFRKLFVAKFHQTPLKYINELRIKKAVELLSSGYYSVTETAEKCGFDSQPYFSNIIKKATGYSPSLFKESKTH